ncbi:PilZ domain-containing protein [Planctomycetota bacterium]
MNEVIMLHGVRSRRVLEAAVSKNIPLVISCPSLDSWTIKRAMITELRADTFDIKITPRKRSQLDDISVGQSLGITIRYKYDAGYDHFVFDTTVTALKSSSESIDSSRIVLTVPDEIEMLQKRSYRRVKAPASEEINVELLDRSTVNTWPEYLDARLVDISAGGLQVAVESSHNDFFTKGQTLGLKFTPLPHETPLMFNAQVRTALPTADDSNVTIGLEILGLEASCEGRMVLQRLCSIVEQYQQINSKVHQVS